ncbi:rhodanese-like domain-containing protein [uncultured Neptuniibacter sp.]|uniref:rhodanese-like domain-containing protein n=1 Tax=uncultured Neptuniibacter sp. TaxID=502143 RepID=UPI0026113436|nr:rhodanese-like domain-containing protein [uncultured Neptuniibacter sp.]
MKHLLLLSALLIPLSTNLAAAEKPQKASAQTTLNLYVTAIEAWDMIQANPNTLLIDVRDPVEVKFTGFATPTDIHIPWMLAAPDQWNSKKSSWAMRKNPTFESELLDKLTQLNADKKTSNIIIMCRSGSTRSAPAVNLLAKLGYQKVWTVVDGFEGSKLQQGDSAGVRAVNGWRNSGLPWSYKVNPDIAWQPHQ